MSFSRFQVYPYFIQSLSDLKDNCNSYLLRCDTILLFSWHMDLSIHAKQDHTRKILQRVFRLQPGVWHSNWSGRRVRMPVETGTVETNRPHAYWRIWTRSQSPYMIRVRKPPNNILISGSKQSYQNGHHGQYVLQHTCDAFIHSWKYELAIISCFYLLS